MKTLLTTGRRASQPGRSVALVAGCWCWLLLAAGPAAGQTPLSKMQQLDTMLQAPLRNKLVTDDAYAATLYQKQVALAGLAVRQGRTLGTNLTADEKSVVANVGLPNIELQSFPNLAVIATGRFTPEDGFVKLLADDKLRKNFSYGGTLLLFGHGNSRYKERTRKDLHWQLRQLRQQDKAKWSENGRWPGSAAEPDSLTPYSAARWQARYPPLAARFILTWRSVQRWLEAAPQYAREHSRADRFYRENGKLTPVELADKLGQKRYLNYLDAEHQLRPLLPPHWDTALREEESRFVRQQLSLVSPAPAGAAAPASPTAQLTPAQEQTQLADSLTRSQQFALTLEAARQRANATALAARYRAYDSLQQHVSWAAKWRWWLTGTVLHNTLEQAVFNAANKTQTYADVYQDNFWQLQGAGNFLREGSTLNTYLSVGAGTNDGRVFKKSDLRTYQTAAWQRTTTDSALVVTQKNLYPALPERIRYLTLQTQLTCTLTRGLPGFGVTATYDTQLAANQHALHNLTLGLILPVRALKSTLLFIPLVRARSADLPDRWSAGFSVTASIPGLSK